MSMISPSKPINDAIPDGKAIDVSNLLKDLALGSLVKQNGGRMVFPLKDLDWIKENTYGLNAEVISSSHVDEKWLVLNLIPVPMEEKII
jgi:hypothetical protein